MQIPSADLYQTYMGNPGLTYQTVGQQFGLTRSQVAGALYRYRKKHKIPSSLPRGNGTRAIVPHSSPPENETEPATNDPPVPQLLHSPHKLSTVKIRPGGSRPYPQQSLRAAVFDIETSDFSATGHRGFMICCSILPLDADAPRTHALAFGANSGEDKSLLEAVVADLDQFDILIGHYIAGFDLPWLYTRADHHNLPALRRWLCFDTYYAARAQSLRTVRKSMAFLLDHFGLENLKTNIYPRLWEDVRSTKRAIFEYSLGQIVDHCELDVIANRMLYDRLEPKSWSFTASPFKMTKWAGIPKRAV